MRYFKIKGWDHGILYAGIVNLSDWGPITNKLYITIFYNYNLFHFFYRNYYTNIVFTQLLITKNIEIKCLTSDYPIDNTKSLIEYLQTYY